MYKYVIMTHNGDDKLWYAGNPDEAKGIFAHDLYLCTLFNTAVAAAFIENRLNTLYTNRLFIVLQVEITLTVI